MFGIDVFSLLQHLIGVSVATAIGSSKCITTGVRRGNQSFERKED